MSNALTGAGNTLILGVINVTPDSFSDGGRYLQPDAAIERAVELTEQGADIIDVGGESTRPGAKRIRPEDERVRILPVVRGLAERGIRVSVDTMHASTARAAAAAGASIVNDVSGGLADPEMVATVIETGVTYVAMHWRGQSDTMDSLAVYTDAPGEIRRELFERAAELVVLGVDPERIVIDPGLGFAKTGEHNWQVLAHLSEFRELGLPVLVGASRKRFLAPLLPEGSPIEARDAPTAIISALAAQLGVWGVRVHDVAGTRRALDVVEAWKAGLHD